MYNDDDQSEDDINNPEHIGMSAQVVYHDVNLAMNNENINDKYDGIVALFDSGAGEHMYPSSLPVIVDYGVSPNEKIRVANDAILSDPHRADARLDLMDNDHVLMLRNALTHPDIRTILISVSALLRDPLIRNIEFKGGYGFVYAHDGRILLTAHCRNGVYVVHLKRSKSSGVSSTEDDLTSDAFEASIIVDADLWHRRASHISHSSLLNTVNSGSIVEGNIIRNSVNKSIINTKCEPCILAKTRRSAASDQLRTEVQPMRPLETMFLDTGEAGVEGPLGEKYVMNAVDGYSSHVSVGFAATKDRLPHIAIKILDRLQRKTSRKIAEIRCDSGSEFNCSVFIGWADSQSIHIIFSPTDVHHLTGKVEHSFQTIFNLTRASMHYVHAPVFLWPYAMQHAVYAFNRMIVQSGKTCTPHQLMFSIKGPISVSELRIWGCRAYMRVLDKHRENKFDARAIPCTHLGYNYSHSSYTSDG